MYKLFNYMLVKTQNIYMIVVGYVIILQKFTKGFNEFRY